MKDYKLKFTDRTEAATILANYLLEDVFISKDNITILDVGIVYDPDPESTEVDPLPGIPRDGYYILVRDMNSRNLFTIDSQYITTDTVGVEFSGKLPVPEKITNGQFRDALVLVGINLNDVDTAINNISNPLQKQLAYNRWQYGNHIERNHPMIIAMAPSFGFTEDAIDEVFRLAESLG